MVRSRASADLNGQIASLLDPPRDDRRGQAIVGALAQRLFGEPMERDRLASSNTQYDESGLSDYLFSIDGHTLRPTTVFDRLRWGGQFVFASGRPRLIEEQARRFHNRHGFVLDQPVQWVDVPRFSIRLSPFRRRQYYFVARKVMLTPPGQTSERYTYNVRLARTAPPDRKYVVLKQVPSHQDIYDRLKKRLPGCDERTLVKHTRKLVDRVFPVFLTRETAFLKILQRQLPQDHLHRVPRVIAADQDDSGVVRKLCLNWLRLGGSPISQLEFAHQSAELLHVLHDQVGLIHLDLRLDNFVITEHGVGFVDFGSAVCVDEHLGESPMLRSLFDEMMSTSQIQRVLGKMMNAGRVTSHFICDSHQKVNKAVDLFYLALQMNQPHSNPDFKGLVRHDPKGPAALHLKNLSDKVLRPKDPGHPTHTCARHLLDGIARIRRALEAS